MSGSARVRPRLLPCPSPVETKWLNSLACDGGMRRYFDNPQDATLLSLAHYGLLSVAVELEEESDYGDHWSVTITERGWCVTDKRAMTMRRLRG